MQEEFLPLKKNSEFRDIYNKGKSLSTKYLVLYYKNSINTNLNAKVGFVASKKVGKATIRNRYKRLIKEVFRVTNLKFTKKVDLIFLARPRIVEVDYNIIKRDIIYLVKRLNKILVEEVND